MKIEDVPQKKFWVVMGAIAALILLSYFEGKDSELGVYLGGLVRFVSIGFPEVEAWY